MNDKIKMAANLGFTGKQWEINESQVYNAWRAHKIEHAARQHDINFTNIEDLAHPTLSERDLILTQCSINGFAFYTSNQPKSDESIALALRKFTDEFGLKIGESHRSASNHSVVALKVTSNENQRGFIPYSRKAMNWHTDGYYNPANDTIRSFVLHCARPAGQGGQNQLIDPEIAYMRLRDLNPDYITALRASDAMTIPANTESDGSIRPASIGPVFKVENGALLMRYTARTRSIAWSAKAAAAAAALQDLLENETEFLIQTTLQAGQGVLSNNALHNRTGFDAGSDPSQRLMYRIRFHNRIEGGQHG